MPGTLRTLPPLDIEGHEPSISGGDRHPMRVMTRRAAGLEQPPWDDEAARTVGAFFDSMAPEWHTRSSAPRTAVVRDALDRGEVGSGRVALEIGSGIGAYSPMLAERYDVVVAMDLSIEMLRLAPASVAPQVQVDASRLPVADSSVDAVVLVNMFLFPDEVARVLRPSGIVVWVNSSGEATPIHLSTAEVMEALPGRWEGVEARAGIGLWAVAARG